MHMYRKISNMLLNFKNKSSEKWPKNTQAKKSIGKEMQTVNKYKIMLNLSSN